MSASRPDTRPEPRSDLRAVLRDRNLLTDEDLAALEAWAPYKGVRLAERLYRSGVLSDAQVAELFVGLGATDGTTELLAALPPPAALGALSRTLAERHRALGIRVERARLVVAMLDPSDTEAVEKISFFAGLAVEPRVVRARVLFQALQEAYGIVAPVPDATFLSSRANLSSAPLAEPPNSDPGSTTLPAPSPDTPFRVFGMAHAAADPASSPLAASVVGATGARPLSTGAPEPKSVLAVELLRDMTPSRTPSVEESGISRLQAQMPPGSPLEARDSLPPMVLRLLVPPLRSAVLFLVRDEVAVGWDGRIVIDGGEVTRAAIRDVLLPLTAVSSFQRALQWKRVAVGNAADPTTTERILWRHLKLPTPSSLAVVPILVGDDVHALLYVDRADGMLDDSHIESARRAGNALADGIAPFVAAGVLFPPVRREMLKPIASVS